MLSTLTYYVRWGAIWLVLFAFGKLYFLWVNGGSGAESLSPFFSVWRAGLGLDLAMIGYYSILPLVLLIIRTFTKLPIRRIGVIYGWLIWIFSALILAVNPYFFYYWGQKTNLDFTQFLGEDSAGIFSIEPVTFVSSILFFGVCIIGYTKVFRRVFTFPAKGNSLVILFLLVLSFILLRGGLGEVPINLSSAYFSQNNTHNNAAVNPVWQFMATEFEKDKHAALQFFETDAQAQEILNTSFKPSTKNLTHLLKPYNEQTNIILVVLESFSAKVVGHVSNSPFASTPRLDSVAQTGIAFSQAYASSFRSDKGLLAITTGIPSGARQTLTNFPSQLAPKPSVFKLFKDDYLTSFYYGGSIEFANIKMLFTEADQVKAIDDFKSSRASTWGIHDEDVFDEFVHDFTKRTKPQFSMLFSLSSHEPFDVPNFQVNADPYLNSISYTDSCLGVMLNQIKQSDKWQNSLIIITADHGVIRPDNAPIYHESNFRIPLVFTGGMVKKDTLISDIVSQADIPATLADYMNQSDFFNQSSVFHSNQRAFYAYHNGVVSITPSCTQYYDINQQKYLFDTCNKPIEKAYYQVANKEFFGR